MSRSLFFAVRAIAPMLFAAGFADPTAAAERSPLPVATTAAPMGGPTLTLVRQSAPALVAPGARRLAELRNEHRSLADLAKRSGQVFEALNQPGIGSVNGRPFSATWFVPGAPYVFRGRGFGSVPGSVKLVGNFPGKAPTFRIDLWQDGAIHAYLEDDITGAYDQEGIQLVVETAAGPLVRPGARFYASREQRVFDLRPYGTLDDLGTELRVSSTAGIVRVERNVQRTAATCADDDVGNGVGGGMDRYAMPTLRSGWVAAGYEWYIGRNDSGPGDHLGQPGSRRTEGRYEVDWAPPRIDVRFATFNSFSRRDCPTADSLWANAVYTFKLVIEGPRGTQPL